MRRFADRHLPTLLNRAAHAVDAEWALHLRLQGVATPVWRVLAGLAEGPPESVSRLAGLASLQQPTMTKLLDRMVRDGLVARSPDARDRRVVRVALTNAGAALAARLVTEAELREGDLLGRHPALAGLSLAETLLAVAEGRDL